MTDELNLSCKRNEYLLVFGLLLIFAINVIVRPEFTVLVIDLLGGEEYPSHGVFVWELDRNRCRQYESAKLLPAGYEEMVRSGDKCGEDFKGTMLRRRLEFINQTTESEEVKETVNKSLVQIKAYNFTQAQRISSKIDVERNYTISAD